MTPAQQALLNLRHLTGKLVLNRFEHQDIERILQIIEDEITPKDK